MVVWSGYVGGGGIVGVGLGALEAARMGYYMARSDYVMS